MNFVHVFDPSIVLDGTAVAGNSEESLRAIELRSFRAPEMVVMRSLFKRL